MNKTLDELKRLVKAPDKCDGLWLIDVVTGKPAIALTPHGLFIQYSKKNMFYISTQHQIMIPVSTIEEQGTDKIYVMRCLLSNDNDYESKLIKQLSYVINKVLLQQFKSVQDIFKDDHETDPIDISCDQNFYLKLRISFEGPNALAREKYNIKASITLYGGNDKSQLKFIGNYWL